VTVSKPEEKLVENWSEFTGRTAAVNFVNVTPRVSGYIVDIPFKEGDLVHQGDLLFQIDPSRQSSGASGRSLRSNPLFSSLGAVLVGSDDGCIDHGVLGVRSSAKVLNRLPQTPLSAHRENRL
jgi:hypothetical protein